MDADINIAISCIRMNWGIANSTGY